MNRVGKKIDKEKIAIIIPVFNEKPRVDEALKHLLTLDVDEIIVVDGGSTDGSYEMIKGEFPVVHSYQTAFAERSFQMNLGAFESQSDVFVFVHVDTRLPVKAVELIREKLNTGYVAGGFCKRYDRSNLVLDIYLAVLNQFYLRRMRCLVGTNAIFVKRQVFEQIKGFPEVPLLEDVIFSDTLRKMGKIAVINESVTVSARKYFENGILRQILRNIRILLGYKMFHENLVKLREIY